MTTRDKILYYLGGGLELTTREISNASGMSLSAIRAACWKLQKEGKLEAFDSGASGTMGNEITWRKSK